MSEEIICPDCGGVIGGEPGRGRAVCKCFEQRPAVAVKAAPPPEIAPDVDLSAPGRKPCRVCGKDLAGRRRLKDSRGYMCPDCDAAERKLHEQAAMQDLSLIPCPECGRRLKPAGITTVNGMVMCHTCAADHKELNKYKAPPPTVEVAAVEKQKLQWLAIAAGVLLLIIALSYFGLIGSGRH